MGVVADLDYIHERVKTKISKDPVYVSAGRKEYRIRADERGLYRIYPYKGGQLAKTLKGIFTQYAEAEKVLIQYLRATDRWNKAIWPGQQQPSIIGRSLRASSPKPQS